MKTFSLFAGGAKKVLLVLMMLACVGFVFAETGAKYFGEGTDWNTGRVWASVDGGRSSAYFDKTELVVVDEVTIKGSGTNGAFTNGRTVKLSSFIIGKYPVTQGLYKGVMQESPSKGQEDTLARGEKQDLRPVEQVDFYSIAVFCNALSRMSGLESAFIIDGTKITVDVTKNGWRIPTEAEWECAARGGNPSNTSAWNNVYAGAKDEKDLLNYAWLKDNSDGNTHEVGLKKPNALGLYDMLGNVYEWCLDVNGSLTAGTFTDPTGAVSGTVRVQRSSSKGSKTSITVQTRDSGEQEKYWSDVGFRLCRTNKEGYDRDTDYNYNPRFGSFENEMHIDDSYLEKTGFVGVKGATVNGFGSKGAFISGRTVTLDSFIIGMYPVTQELYKVISYKTPSIEYTNPSDGDEESLTSGETQKLRPVEQVDFFEVAAFCNQLSELQGLEPVFTIKGDSISYDITKNGWRVPTDAEWEFAARGGNPNDLEIWNNLYTGAKDKTDLLNYAWIKDNSGGVTHEVGLKKPNALGLYDMLGNVYEWCLDLNETITTGSVKNPTGASTGTKRVRRGGANGTSSATTVRTRESSNQSDYFSNVGFRLCRTSNMAKELDEIPISIERISGRNVPLANDDPYGYRGGPDYGEVYGNGACDLSGDTLTIYVPANITIPEYSITMVISGMNMRKIKAPSIVSYDESGYERNGEAAFWDGWDYYDNPYSSRTFSWNLKNSEKFELIFEDGSSKTYTAKVKTCGAINLSVAAGERYNNWYSVRFQYKDPDPKYVLTASDIIVQAASGDYKVEKLIKTGYEDANGAEYILYYNKSDEFVEVSFSVNRPYKVLYTGCGYDDDLYYIEYNKNRYFTQRAPDFSGITINGKTYEKTGFVEVVAGYNRIPGSGSKGAFVDGREVSLSSFMIGQYQVTQELYQAVMGTNPSNGTVSSLTAGERQELRPVERVTYIDAAKFCNKLSELQGLQPVFTINGDEVTFDRTKNGWRLPTEAEWEFAARGGFPYSEEWKNIYAGGKDADDALANYVWMKENSNNETHEVGLKKPNSIGMYDALGNVLEWCLDWNATREKGYYENPVGPETGTARVYRGGSKSDSISSVNLMSRNSAAPEKKYFNLGIRLCRNLPYNDWEK